MGRKNQNKQAGAGPPGLDVPMPDPFGFPPFGMMPMPMPMPMMPMMPMPMVPPFGAYPMADPSLAAAGGEDDGQLADKNAELMRQNMELRAEIDYMAACSAMSEAWKENRRKQLPSKYGKSNDAMGRTASNKSTSSFINDAMLASELDDSPKSRVSRTSRKAKSGKDDMSRTPSTATTMAMSYALSDGTSAYSGSETPKSRVSRASRRVDFAKEVDGKTRDEKTSKVRFELPRKVTEEHFGDAADSEEQGRNAMMMRNIPKEYTRANLIELLDKEGFNGLYQLVYVPANMDTELNYGYAFVCFTTEEDAMKYKEHFTGFKDWLVSDDKVCEVCFNEQLPTTEGHIQRYKDSPMMHESVDDRFRPALFENGQRVAFPAPTKEIKAPRRRNKNSAPAGA